MLRWCIARLLFLPTLMWGVLTCRLLRIRNVWDWVDDHVLLGVLPFKSDVAALADAGVRAVINTCEEYSGPVEAYESTGIVQLRLPTIDYNPPNLEDIERGVAFIDESVAKDESVYVHCKAGRGRSATVVLCWLIAAKGMTPEQAQRHLLDIRPHVSRHLAARAVVKEFAARRKL